MLQRFLGAVLLVLLLVSPSLRSVSADDAFNSPVVDVTDMFNRLNGLRESKQRVPLTLNPALVQAAQEQADYISQTGHYAHVRNGSSPQSRALSANYQTNVWCCSENTHRTQVGKSAWVFWNQSLPHYYNMINPKWTEIGIATSQVGPWTGWVMVFGSGIQALPTPAPATSVSTVVPPVTSTVSGTSAPVVSSPSLPRGSYRVVWGDTLSKIAQRHGVSLSDLRAVNTLSDDVIYAGQILVLPQGASAAVLSPANSSATLQITSPSTGAVMSGAFPIIGSVNLDDGQAAFYKVEISGGQFGSTWVTVGDVHNTSVRESQLEYLNGVQAGRYEMRLVVVGTDGNHVSSYNVSFQVQ